MSIESVAIALHHSQATGTAKLVLVGIANHDGDGGSFPKVATLAKYANVHPRRIPAALKVLGELGEIIVHEKDGGTRVIVDAIRPNLYEFILECPPECDRTKHHRIEGQKIGRSYKGQYDKDRVKDPGYVKRAKEAHQKAQKAVENATIPPSAPNSTSAANSTTPGAPNSTTPGAPNSTTKNHQVEPPLENPLGSYLTSGSGTVDNLPALPQADAGRNDATAQTTSTKDPLGLTEEQMSRNKRGAALARAVLRGEQGIKDAPEDRKLP